MALHGFRLRPLREDSGRDEPALALGADLLAKVGPVARSEARKRRVWNALQGELGPSLGLRYRTLRLTFAALLVAAASSAAMGGYYATRSPPAEPARSAVSSTAPASTKAAHVARPTTPSVAAEPIAAPLPSSKPSASSPRKEPKHASKPAPGEAESQLLVEAMRARREGDSARVGKLVDEYRLKHPQGALQEEALILSIESAVARRAPQAKPLADEYLARYPQGRFVAQAKRAASLEAR